LEAGWRHLDSSFSIITGMRRRPGTILPIERELLAAAAGLAARGVEEFHGFLIAHEMRDRSGARDLIAYGNLYRVLERMEKAGWLASAWEDPAVAEAERRARRRLYKLTGLGIAAAARSSAAEPGIPLAAPA
jgi:PadR family transcriptional regulator, regulatory protein PadR